MSAWFRDTDEYRHALAEERLVVAVSELITEALEHCGQRQSGLAEGLAVPSSATTWNSGWSSGGRPRRSSRSAASRLIRRRSSTSATNPE